LVSVLGEVIENSCKGVLIFLGMGLSHRHLTKEALETLRDSDVVFLETYTSIVEEGLLDYLKGILGGKPIPLTRKDLEEDNAVKIFRELADGRKVTLAVIGDPFQATTHNMLRAEAVKRGCRVRYVAGISIYSYAVSLSGLYNYKFGAKATIVYPRWGILSEHPYDVLKQNKDHGLHTFFYLDIDPQLGPMKPDEAVRILLELEGRRKEGVFNPEEKVLVLERLGWSEEGVYYWSAYRIIKEKRWSRPPYSLIVPGKLNRVEEEIVEALWGEET